MNRGRGHNIELRGVKPLEEEAVYYNAVTGTRISQSLSVDSYESVTPSGRHDVFSPTNFSQGSDYDNASSVPSVPLKHIDEIEEEYEDTTALSLLPTRPRIEEFDTEYEDASTLPRLPSRPPPLQEFDNGANVFVDDFTPRKPREYEVTPGTLTRSDRPDFGKPRFDYEDIPERPERPVLEWQGEDVPSVKENKRRCAGSNWKRVVIIWIVLLLGMVIAGIVYITLLQIRVNILTDRVRELESEFNLTSTLDLFDFTIN